jgi:hypothetical protein
MFIIIYTLSLRCFYICDFKNHVLWALSVDRGKIKHTWIKAQENKQRECQYIKDLFGYKLGMGMGMVFELIFTVHKGNKTLGATQFFFPTLFPSAEQVLSVRIR